MRLLCITNHDCAAVVLRVLADARGFRRSSELRLVMAMTLWLSATRCPPWDNSRDLRPACRGTRSCCLCSSARSLDMLLRFESHSFGAYWTCLLWAGFGDNCSLAVVVRIFIRSVISEVTVRDRIPLLRPRCACNVLTGIGVFRGILG